MEKTKRQSNFELLRIFAIVLIVLFHIQKKGPQRLLTGDYGYFAQPFIYPRLLILEFGVILGMIGNGVFLLISGYFMNAAADINIGKIAKKLLLQLGFAVLVLVIANSVWIAFFKNDALTLGMVTKRDFNGNWWFVGYYFLVILAAKLFLNRFTAKLTRNQFKSLLLTVLAVSQFSWTGTMLGSLASGLRDLAIGVFFFLMGGYIARFNPFKNLKSFTFILTIAAAYGIRFLSQYNIVSESIDEFVESKSTGNFVQSVQDYLNYYIPVVIIAVCLFELFRRLNIPYNAVINFIGKSTLMIYFIHENSFFQMFYRDDSWMETLQSSCLLYCLKWFKWAAIAFAVGLAAYAAYALLGKLLPRMRSLVFTQSSSERSAAE